MRWRSMHTRNIAMWIHTTPFTPNTAKTYLELQNFVYRPR